MSGDEVLQKLAGTSSLKVLEVSVTPLARSVVPLSTLIQLRALKLYDLRLQDIDTVLPTLPFLEVLGFKLACLHDDDLWNFVRLYSVAQSSIYW